MSPKDTEQFAQLELQVRRLRIALVLGALGLAVVFGAGWKPDDGIVEATKFVLLDAQGHPVAILGTDAETGSGLRLLGSTEDARAAFTIKPNGDPELEMSRNVKALARVRLGCTSGGLAFHGLQADDNVAGVQFQFRNGEYSHIAVMSSDRASEVNIGVSADTAGLGGHGPHGGGFAFSAPKNQEVSMLLRDPDRKNRVELRVPAEGDPVLEFKRADGEVTWRAGGK